MPSPELQSLASRLGRPVKSLGALDVLPAESLARLHEAVERNQQIERERLNTALDKALPAAFWRIALLGIKREAK